MRYCIEYPVCMKKQFDGMKLDHSDIASAYTFTVDLLFLGVVETNVRLFFFLLIIVRLKIFLSADLPILLLAFEKF